MATAPVPALAHEKHDFGLSVEPLSEQEAVSGTTRIRGRIFLPQGVERWALEVRHLPGAAHPGFGQHQTHESERRVSCPYPYPQDGPGAADRNHPGSPDGERKTVTVDCSWDTRTYGDGSPSFNGGYLVVLTAWNADVGLVDRAPTEPHSSTLATTVANPAAAPTGLATAYSDPAAQVTLRWTASPDPDLTGYVLQEEAASRGWATVEEPGPRTTTVVRQLTSAGVYRYRLAARRPGGSGTQVRSEWVTPEDGPDPVVVSERGGGLTDPTSEAAPESSSSGPGGDGISHDASIRPEPGAGDTSIGAARAAPPLIVEPPRRPKRDQRPAGLDQTTPEGDDGFSEKLPYEAEAPGAAPSNPEVAAPLATGEEAQGTSPGLIAGGLLLLALAIMGLFICRKARQGPVGV